LKQKISFYETDEPKPESNNEKTIVVDECLIDVIKSMNTIIKDERAKIEKFRESDHKHYQESVDELHRAVITKIKWTRSRMKQRNRLRILKASIWKHSRTE